ncbi:MAG: hypothetical protein ABIP53_08850 [Candidatus Limnocylindrales bacterium]
MRRYTEALTRWDYETIAKLRHPEWKAIWPQSGEVVNSTQDDQKIAHGYPGGRPTLVPGRMIGSEDRWVTSPLGGAFRVAGDGESWWGEWRMTYPDGKTWFTITLIELLDGMIWRETTYWAEPFDAPEWRHSFVERLEHS